MESASGSAGAQDPKVAATDGAWILCPQQRTVSSSTREHGCAPVQQGPESSAQQLAGSPDFPFRRAPTPRPGPLGNYLRPAAGSAGARGRGGIVKRRRLQQTRSRAGSGPSQRAERKLRPLPGWAGGGLAPRSPALPLLPPADWKRPRRRRPGWERRTRCSRGTAEGQARLQAVGKAGGRGHPAGARRPLRWVPPAGPCLSFFSVWWMGVRVINHRERVSRGPSLPASRLAFSPAAGGSLFGCRSPTPPLLLISGGPSSFVAP